MTDMMKPSNHRHENIKCAGAGTVVDPIHHRHSPLMQPSLTDAETEKTKLAPRLLVISQFTNNIFVVDSGTGKSHPSHGKLSSSPTDQSSRRLLFGSRSHERPPHAPVLLIYFLVLVILRICSMSEFCFLNKFYK